MAYVESTGFKNKIINGDFRIFERGNSSVTFANTTQAIGYVADRFSTTYTGLTSTTALTVSKSTMTFEGSVNQSLRIVKSAIAGAVLTGTTHALPIRYVVEDFDSYGLNGKKVTLSFVFFASVAGTYSVAIKKGNLTSSYVTTFTVASNTPTKIVKTLTIPEGFTSAPVGNAGIEILIGVYNGTAGTYTTSTLDSFVAGDKSSATTSTNWLANASADVIEIAKVQLELGDTATSFEYKPIGTELALCQRYYEVIDDGVGGGWRCISIGFLSNSNIATSIVPFKVRKRAETYTLVSSNGTPLTGRNALGFNTRLAVACTGTAGTFSVWKGNGSMNSVTINYQGTWTNGVVGDTIAFDSFGVGVLGVHCDF